MNEKEVKIRGWSTDVCGGDTAISVVAFAEAKDVPEHGPRPDLADYLKYLTPPLGIWHLRERAFNSDLQGRHLTPQGLTHGRNAHALTGFVREHSTTKAQWVAMIAVEFPALAGLRTQTCIAISGWPELEGVQMRLANSKPLRVLAAACGSAGFGHSFELTLPIGCEVGQTCFIQNYVDHDLSPGAQDYMCGAETNHGHNGTDFRLPSMAEQRAGIPVLAAADGQVLRTRDSMPDLSVRTLGSDQIKGRECGNGVIVAHADGFESEYCHLARSSVRVKPGDLVKSGQVLGNVGLSGNTEFAHLHFTLRQNGKVIDPFAYGAPDGACGGGRSLWNKDAAGALAYQPVAILNTGFAAHPVTAQQLEAGSIGPVPQEGSENCCVCAP